MSTPYDPYATPVNAFPVVPQSQIPGNNIASQSMTINTSSLNFASYTAGGMFGYTGTPGAGQLFFSVSPLGGSDAYGNAFPAGLAVPQGNLAGMTIVGSSMDQSSIINGATLNGVVSTQPNISGGTAASMLHIINSAGGGVYSYNQNTTTVTFGTAASGTGWTVPTGITQIQVQCWGAGGGGDGGQTYAGGSGGGGGEYAAEPHLNVVPGQVFGMAIGQGGGGGNTGFGGSGGGNTAFGNQTVVANGGGAGNNGNPGAGGTGSVNTVHNDGGAGGDNFAQNSGASGGGGGADVNGSGGAGADSTGSGGAAGGTAGGGGTAVAGTAGAASGASASDVSGVGGGGGGAGEGTASNTETNYYDCQFSCSYYGSQAGSGNSNQQRGNSNTGTGGTMYQGCSNGQLSVTGDQYSFALMPYTQMESDLAGATINSVQLQLTNLHSWYDTGCYVVMGFAPFTTFGQTGNISGSNPNAQVFWIDEGATVFQSVIRGWGTVFQSGAAKSLMFGPSAASSGGSPTDLYNYGYFYGFGNIDLTPIMAITFTVAGSGSQNAGDGGDGQISITYTSSANQTMNVSMSPMATTDTFNNTIPTGIMVSHNGSISTSGVSGAVVVTQNPNNAATAPATPELWHQMPTTLLSGWGGANGLFYRMTPWDTVQIFGSILHTASTFTVSSSIIWTLPTAYWPTRTWNVGSPGIAGRVAAEVTNAGVLTALNPANQTVQECDVSGEYPLHI